MGGDHSHDDPREDKVRADDDAQNGAHPAAEEVQRSSRVQLADQIVPLSALRSDPDRFAQLFIRARAEVGHAVCQCRVDEPARLVIRCRSGRYHLAVWPDRGHEHAPHCVWYRPDPALSGLSSVIAGNAIVTTDYGTSLRLATPLTTRPSQPGVLAAPMEGDQADVESGHVLTLLAVTHYLWERARLSLWSPHDGQRTWRTCHARLLPEAQECSVNGQNLGDALYIVPPFEPAAAERNAEQWDFFAAGLGQHRHRGSRRRGLVLGEIRCLDATEYGICLRLAHHRAPLFASHGLVDRARRSYRSAFSETNTGGHRVAMLLVDRSPRGYTIAMDMAVVLTSAAYIPVESHYERRMADALVGAGRVFVKPLHYQRSDEVFPDFVLLDTTPPTYVEVWGIQGRERYEQRKQTKKNYYRTCGKTLLEWDVGQPLPTISQRAVAPQ